MDASHQPKAAPKRSWSRTLLGMTRTVLIGAVITVAVLLGLARLLLPMAETLRPEVEVWVSQLVDRSVRIGALTAEWQGWTPVLRLEDVRVIDEDGETELARFARAHVTVDLVKSLAHGAVRAGELGVTGAKVTVTRRGDGTLLVAGRRPRKAALGAWLLSQPELALEAASVLWHDRRAGLEPITLSAVNVRVRNDGGRRRISGTGALPSGFGERVSFAAELRGDVRSPDWAGTVFLRGEGIASALWAPFLEQRPVHLAGGAWTFSLWSTWRAASLERVRGQMEFRDVLLEAGERVLALDAGGGRVLLRRAAQGWQLDLTELELDTPRGGWPRSAATLRVGAETAPGVRRYRGTLDFVRLDDVMPLVVGVAPPGELTRALTRLAPRGELRHIAFALTPREGETAEFQVGATLRGVSIEPTDDIPGLSGLAGRLEVAPDRALLELDTKRLDARWPGMFSGPLGAQVSGRIGWHREGAGWRLEVPRVAVSNADLEARLSGHLRTRPGESPTLNLVAEVRGADLPALRDYIPRPVVPEPFTRWAERAFQAGRVEAASLLINGRLADFPFDGSEGTFQLHTEIRDGVLRYAPGWPSLEAYRGALAARGRDLTMRLTEGTVAGARVLGAQAHIRDIGEVKPAILELSGQLRGDAGQGLAFLRASPLQARFEPLTTALEASGEMRVDLELALPLGPHKSKAKREVRGALHLTDARVLGHRLDVTFEQASGTVRFGAEGVSADGIQARYLGREVSVAIEQDPPPDGRVRVRLEGAAGRDFIGVQLRKLGMSGDKDSALAALLPRVDGATRWRTTLHLPVHTSDPIGVHFESSLAGLALALPDPLGKGREEARKLVIDATVSQDESRLLRLRYGADLHTVLAFAREGDGLRLERGTVRLGEGEPVLPADGGISVRGRSTEISLDGWFPLLRELRPQGTGGAAKARRPRLRELDLQIARLGLFGQWFRDVHLDARPQAESAVWLSELRGEGITGHVRIPMPASPKEPLVLRFQRLFLNAPAETSGGTHYDPRQLPPLDFSSERLVYDDIELGRVTLEASPFEQGLRIDRFVVRSPHFDASAQGTWRYADGAHESRSSLHVRSPRIAPLLEAFGYAGGAIEGGDTTIDIDAGWPGPPTDFTLAHLTGSLDFRITEGRLVEVEKGTTGRLFGLLSVQLLPKRLMLDFSDLFAEGVRYETIKGNFDIVSGTAYTTNLLMRGPSVRVEVQGRVDLMEKTYDQTMTVIPKLTSSLPLAPVWLAEKLLDTKVFDRSFAQRYKITGTWQDPQVALIEEEPRPVSPFER